MFPALRLTARQLAKSPLFATVTVLTLALGIGVNAAIFTLVRSILLRDLPYPQPQELVNLALVDPSGTSQNYGLAGPEVPALQRSLRTLKDAAGWVSWSFLVRGSEQATVEPGAFVSGNLFALLDVRPLQGRTLTRDDDRPDAPLVAVIGESFWRRALGGRADVLGSALSLGDQTATIVGVVPAEFSFAEGAGVFLPLAHNPFATNARVRLFNLLGRLAPGATPAQATAEATALLTELSRQSSNPIGERVPLVRGLQEEIVRRVRPALLALQAAGALLLAATFATLLLLMFARNSAREREFCVRLALGAGRRDIARLILLESGLLALGGGGLGVLLAVWTLDSLLALAPDGLLPRQLAIGFDPEVFLFSGGLVLLGGGVFGLVSAARRRETELTAVLKSGGRSATTANPRSRQLLVMAEIAVAIVLLSSIALLGRSLVRLLQVDPGFAPENLVAFQIRTGGERYATPAQRTAFFQDLERRLAAIPGVSGIGGINRLPFLEGGPENSRSNVTTRMFLEGRTYASQAAGEEPDYRVASPGYFGTMRIPLRAGRLFTWDEANNGRDVIVINETAARRYWPGEDPVGQRVKFALSNADTPWITVIGVVGDVRHFNLELAPRPEIYRPFLVNPMTAPALAVRVAGQPEAFVATLRQTLREMDPGLAPSNFTPMTELVQRSHAQRRFLLLVLGAFGGLTLLLAVLGLYGVVSQFVLDRRFEFATRAALGATPADLSRLVLHRWLMIALPALLIGVGGSLAAARLLQNLLFGTPAHDPFALAAAAGLIAVVAWLACYFPARRAARTDPMAVLRAE
jgi:predicted permease